MSSFPPGIMAGLCVICGREKPERGRLDPGSGSGRAAPPAQAFLHAELGRHPCKGVSVPSAY